MAREQPVTDVKFRLSCDACLNAKVKCGQTKPSCARCLQHGHKCVYSQYRKIGRPSHKAAAAAAASAAATAGTTTSAVPLLPAQSPGRRLPQQQQQRTTPRTEPAAADYRSPAPSDRACVHVRTDSSHTDTLVVAPSTPEPTPEPPLFTARDAQFGDAASLAGDSVMAMDVGGRVDYDMGTIDSSHLDNMLDLSVAAGGDDTYPSYQLQLDDILVIDATNPISPSPATLSYSSGGDGRGVPHPSLTDDLSAALGEGFFRAHYPPLISRHHHHAASAASLSDALASSPAPAPLDWPRRRPSTTTSTTTTTHLSRTNFFCAREPLPTTTTTAPLYASGGGGSGCSSRCLLRCHVDLTNLLACISEFQGRGDGTAALDTLLALDHRVRATRATILGCPVCVGRGRCGQTLLLLTMVVSNLLGLFEGGCAAAVADPTCNDAGRSNSTSTSNGASTSSLHESSRSSRSSSSSWLDSALGTFPSSSSFAVESPPSVGTRGGGNGSGGCGGGKNTSNHNAPPPVPTLPPPPSCPLLDPRMPRPLTVGDVQLSAPVRRAFCRRLLRLYLDRQRDALAQLAQVLAGIEAGGGGDANDVNCSVTRELLDDARRRIELLLGYLALTEPDAEPPGRVLACARLDAAHHG